MINNASLILAGTREKSLVCGRFDREQVVLWNKGPMSEIY